MNGNLHGTDFHDFGQELEPLKQLGLRILVNLWVVHMFYVGKKQRIVDVRKMAKKRSTVYKCCTSPSNLVLAILCDLIGMVK